MKRQENAARTPAVPPIRQMDGILGSEGGALWLRGTEMTALRLLWAAGAAARSTFCVLMTEP